MSQALIWAVLGVVLIIAELMSMGFVLVFFGLGALLTALLVYLGLLPGFYVPIFVFCGISVTMMLLMRSLLKRLFAGHKDMDPEYLGQTVLVVKDIPAEGEGAVSWRGSEWLAFSDVAFRVGEKARVIGREGIRLQVEPIAGETEKEKRE